MPQQSIMIVVATALSMLAGAVRQISAADPELDDPKRNPSATRPAAGKIRVAVDKALEFLQTDAATWRKERGCATCHHGTMTVWALGEAKQQGYAVHAGTLADVIQWTKDRFVPTIDRPRDPRPGWRLVSVPGMYLGMMSHNLPILSRDEVNKVAVHLARHQEEDGTFEMPPPKNGAPPIWESPETVALQALLAWEPFVPADPKEAAAAKASRDKTVLWLTKTKPGDTTQTATFRLLLDVRTGKSPPQIHAGIDRLLKRQNPDGGWSQTDGLPSDGFATGQALYALSFAAVNHERPELQRAVAFLVATQQADGSWPMTSRNHPGVESTKKPIRNPVPITYFGSAWATIGLVRSSPPAADTPANQQRAFDSIRAFHGKFQVDDKSPGRPVIGVDLRYYEIDDAVLAKFAKELQAFPRLTALQFKSPKITDAGLAHMKSLAQLRSLALENATVTDAGLAHLQALTYLESLNLKGTKVTAAGVQRLQKAAPKVKVDYR
ncbi:MAG: hypothetical protein L0Y71_25115 [Gemmataceae bacterium]|nr:hypothetical protein [Gemmataceae bacterium]